MVLFVMSIWQDFWKYVYNRHFKSRILFLFSPSPAFLQYSCQEYHQSPKSHSCPKPIDPPAGNPHQLRHIAGPCCCFLNDLCELWCLTKSPEMSLHVTCLPVIYRDILSRYWEVAENFSEAALSHSSSTAYGSIISDLNFLPCCFSN